LVGISSGKRKHEKLRKLKLYLLPFCFFNMHQENRILFWFRENLELSSNKQLISAIRNCSSLIPVFCFDPREPRLLDEEEAGTFRLKLVEKVINLRNGLLNKGSNLLVVNDHYEKIIPSLARVLEVNLVVTDNTDTDFEMYPEIKNHRSKKTNELAFLLNMHSIELKSLEEQTGEYAPDIFPCFPDINPGIIPSVFPTEGKSNLISASI
jgi:deoxyribodipyrimidine photolyase